MSYDSWKTAVPERKEHTDYGCVRCRRPENDQFGCDSCHEFQIDLALNQHCRLCSDMLDADLKSGKRCGKHFLHIDNKDGLCDECYFEKQVQLFQL